MNEQPIGPYPDTGYQALMPKAEHFTGTLVGDRTLATRDHLFTVDACGGDAELICVLQKVMEKFCPVVLLNDGTELKVSNPNQAAVAEWFYAKYGIKR